MYSLLQGILSSVYLDGIILHKWKTYKIPFANLNEIQNTNPSIQASYSGFFDISARKSLKEQYGMIQSTHLKYHYEVHTVRKLG